MFGVDRESTPYVGPRPIAQGEVLFGRDREIRTLIDLLIAKRIVLLHSPSGAGKSSLINAGLIPALQREAFYILAPMRVNKEVPTDLAGPPSVDPPNRYVYSALRSLEESWPAAERLAPPELVRCTLAGYLNLRRDRMAEEAPVLIFDQFEEVLTTDPVDLAAKQHFFAQVGELLRDRRNWALFAMREDYVGSLDPYLSPLPTQLSVRMRLDFLSVDAAREAIQRTIPANEAALKEFITKNLVTLEQSDPGLARQARDLLAGKPIDRGAWLTAVSKTLVLQTFTADAAQKLADDLRQISTQQADGSRLLQPGPYVEPVQMQVVCKRLWDNKPADKTQIDVGMVEVRGSVDEALAGYFGEKVTGIAMTLRIQEWRMRDWFDHKLITAGGIRGQVMREPGASEGLNNEAIQELINAYLVREERRRGVTWYELAHDRLVDPIRNANRAWRSDHLSPFHEQATRWAAQRWAADLLLTQEQAQELEQWEEAHPGQLTDDEQDLLEASQAAQNQRRNQLAQEARRGTNLAQRGWGVIFAHDIGPDVRQALASLLALRKSQATALYPEYYHEFTYLGAEGARPAETLQQFLTRYGAGISATQPEVMPYYLLLVGSPATIPFAVQYELDLQYAVGRLYFDTPAEYLNYAQSVVVVEAGGAPASRRAAFFGPAHPNDRATQLTADHLVSPLVRQIESRFADWHLTALIRDAATKPALLALLTGEARPDLLFAVGHGMPGADASAAALDQQGALLCQEWPGPQSGAQTVSPTFYFGGDDIPAAANLQGLIVFLSVDYGAGAPAPDESAEIFKTPLNADLSASLAHLPLRLLGHPGGGALAVCSHVDKQSFAEGGLLEVALFAEVIGQLMNGYTVGAAMASFNQRYALFAARISELLRQRIAQEQNGRSGVIDATLTALMTAMVNARNYIILGDPAARLPLEDAAVAPVSAGARTPLTTTTSVALENESSIALESSLEARTRSAVAVAYAELEIRLRSFGNTSYGCEMRFSRPPEGEIIEWGAMRFTIDFDLLSASDPQAYGKHLTAMFFVEPVRNAFAQAQAAVSVQNIPLRVYLTIDDSAAKLQMVAWESLQDPLAPPMPLLLRRQLFFARYRSSAHPPPRPMRQAEARVLLLVANPGNLARYGRAPFDMHQIYDLLQHTLGDRSATQLTPTTLAYLQHELSLGYDILYMVAHSVSTRNGRHALLLAGADGQAVRVSYRKFEEIFQTMADPPRLVILGAAQELSAPGSDTQNVLAARLVEAGVPAVLTFQQAMPTDAMLRFLTTFFRELARDGLVDRAVAAARAALGEQSGWWAPVLFMRLKSGRLWLTAETPTAETRTPFLAPALPTGYVPRSALVATIVERLTDDVGSSIIALQGIGGSGKSVLAAAACHQTVVRNLFTDGILWLRLGPTPDLARLLSALVAAATGDTPGVMALTTAQAAWGRIAQERALLVVLDDLWRAEHLHPFLHDGPRCRYLLTTRNRSALPTSAEIIDVGAMTEAEALQLLWLGLPPDERAAGLPLVKRLGALPLALSLANVTLQRRLNLGQDVAGAIDYLSRSLDRKGLSALDKTAGAGQGESITALLETTLAPLTPALTERLTDLAVFPEDTDIPQTLLDILWAEPTAAVPAPTTDLLRQLSDLALVSMNPVVGTIRLQPLIRTLLSSRAGDTLVARHAQLLDACWRRFALASWAGLPTEQAYLWRYLPYHLTGAGRSTELYSLLFQFDWLQTRLAITDLATLLADYQQTSAANADIGLVESALSLSQRVLAADKTQLAAQLTGRLADYTQENIRTLLAGASQWRGGVWLRPLAACLTPPTKIAVTNHSGPVSDLVFTPDGRWLLSAAWDGTVRVWDAGSGRAVTLLGSHDDRVGQVVVTSNGQWAIAAALDGAVKMWELATLPTSERQSLDAGRVLAGHTGPVWALTCAANRPLIASASADGTVCIWNLDDSNPQALVLQGHTDWVQAVAFTPDGRLVIAASWDGAVCVWDTATGALQKTLQSHGALINSLAVTPDGVCLLAAADDGTLMLWDLATGQQLATLTDHAAPVHSVAISPNGAVAVSAAADGGIMLWDLPAGTMRQRLPDRTAMVRELVWLPAGDRFVAVDEAGLVIVWDVATGQAQATFYGEGAMWCCAVAPDGRTIAAGDSLGRVSFLRPETFTG